MRKLTTLLIALVAICSVSAASGDPEAVKLTINTAMPAAATDVSGADVTYHVLTTDPAGATCSTGASGTNFSDTKHFPIGNTTLTCTANTDSTLSDSAVVTVQDTAPSIAQPSDLDVNTTDSTGTSVNFGPFTASDLVDGTLPVTCSPASGTNFDVGTAPVSCSATDSASNTTTVGFTVTVHLVAATDTEAPTFTTVPGPITTTATSPSGAVVSYTITASDNSGSASITCDHPSGSTFAVGVTTVQCTATDPSENTTTTSFSVTVNPGDIEAPTFSNVPSSRTVEANGPSGSVATYTTPTATDAAEGPKPVTCMPSSGSTFPLGATTVTCTASDSQGNTGQATFTISVVDTTKPSLTVPRDSTVYADTPQGISDQGYGVSQFLTGASARDTVDTHPIVRNDAPEFFTIGVHGVTFTAYDASGNSTSKVAVLEVLPMPPPGTPPLPIPAPRGAPPDVTNLKAEAGDGLVRLSWQLPAGVDHLVITRALSAGGASQVVYTGSGEVFTDRSAVNDLEYRYLVVSVDKEGESSPGVAAVALPKQTLLKTPKDGARLRKAPILRWVPNSEANYYNVQLFRGTKKILSIWPVKATLQLKKQWRYQKHTYKLSRGVYRWYVWPGFGARKAVDYGEMLGFSTFQIIR
jgi:hypothetical protein